MPEDMLLPHAPDMADCENPRPDAMAAYTGVGFCVLPSDY